MTRQKLYHTLVTIILLLAAVFYCFETLLERDFNLFISGSAKSLLVIPLLLILVFATRWMRGSIRRKVIFVLAIILIIYSRPISDRAFLGQPIASYYSGQDAGFQELYLFSSGRYRISYGGIFGVTNNHYGRFAMADTTVYIDNTAGFRGLWTGTIEVNNRKMIIKKR